VLTLTDPSIVSGKYIVLFFTTNQNFSLGVEQDVNDPMLTAYEAIVTAPIFNPSMPSGSYYTPKLEVSGNVVQFTFTNNGSLTLNVTNLAARLFYE
jgi:hypothetical protein